MSGRSLSVYETAMWGSRLAGAAVVRKDNAGILYVDEVEVKTVDLSGQFSVLGCIDGRSHVVLTSFLRLVPDAQRNVPSVEHVNTLAEDPQ